MTSDVLDNVIKKSVVLDDPKVFLLLEEDVYMLGS